MAACLAFLAGIALHAVHETPLLVMIGGRTGVAVGVLVGGVVCAVSERKEAVLGMLACCGLAAFLSYDAVLAPPWDGPARLPKRDYAGIVTSSPKDTPYGTKLVAESVAGQEPLPGPFLVTAQNERTAIALGDIVQWTCAADVVTPQPGPGYDDYLQVRGITRWCSVPFPPRVIGHIAPPMLVAVMDALRRGMRRKVHVLYPEPDGSMLMGLLVGETDGLTKEVKNAFRQTGTSHILAVSGYNVTQLMSLVTFLLALAGLPRQRAAVACAGVVIAFTVLAGAEASVVRAACMGCTGLLARLYRRRYGGTIATLAAAALMTFVNPFVLAHDAGFQLSFLAVIGLQTFGKPFERFFAWMPEVAGLRRMAAETSAATIATLPLTIYAFGMFPPMALFVNLIVLPFIPFAMIIGAVSLLLAIPTAALGALPAIVTSFLIRGVLTVIRGFAAWQPAFVVTMPAWGLAAGYACIIALWKVVHRPKPAYLRKPV
jgi:competence protein ComEC